ncbi:hypothetical protein EMIHUDRAFT_214132 [Emiliania huxleyi CCMP1516]|uniref:Uncharacterized protein n=2 Tax=Emiliania huxleyi TaxID=2903 RepID=A0A0D3IKN3_EMIH1|nr:hypothetical protein EMIHUDRAFT_214132 [Emiliania huxleyi CCMP1516]EOD11818.1 hypothetical protein EMIHUDRAFT_214132 [Emiliania huxleyi CCMP1516]|eukprot:XP_005764247.1 hypothetical protein EMIHUDRAFT_214132 [Emiliania huxleyi CCMP1516]
MPGGGVRLSVWGGAGESLPRLSGFLYYPKARLHNALYVWSRDFIWWISFGRVG